jgi:ribosomal protein S18 acetylase RimI-like enzyme
MAPAPDARQRAMHAGVVDALAGDPFLVYDVDPGSLERTALLVGEAAAWLSHHPWRGVRWITAVAKVPETDGSRAAAVALVDRLAQQAASSGTPATGVTWPRSALELLPGRLRPAHHEEWDHWFTVQAPRPAQLRTTYPVDPEVVDLAADDPRIPQLLEIASPDAPIRPGDPRVVRWAAIEDPDAASAPRGVLAMAAVTAQRSGAAHLNDVATHPAARGRGLARLLCGRVTVDALAEGRPAVTLGMYTDNVAARRLYTGLGFTCLHSFASGELPPAEEAG